MSLTVYLNGQYVPHEAARVPVEDRGFLFGDGIYEVIKVFAGRPFRLQEHLDRLARSAGEIQLRLPGADLAAVSRELIAQNGLAAADALIYIQVTRGHAVPRTHHFPPPETPPTDLVIVRGFTPPSRAVRERGVRAVTYPDQRWGRCDIKSINLLPNAMAKQAAVSAAAFEAILVRDGIAIEGSSSNLFTVRAGTLFTYPRGPQILGGITREAVIGVAGRLGYTVREEPIPLAGLWEADEVFLTSTTMEAMPVVEVDGRAVGGGRPGPVTRALYEGVLELAGAPA